MFALARFALAMGALLAAAAVAPTNLAAAETPPLARLVGNKDQSTQAIVDPVSGKVERGVPTGRDPHEIAASADGKFAFVANYGTVPSPGSRLKCTPDGKRVLIGDLDGGELGVLDAASHKSPDGVPDGGPAYIAVGDNRADRR